MTEDMAFCLIFTLLALCLWQVVLPAARERRSEVKDEVPAGEVADVQLATSYLMFFASVGLACFAAGQIVRGFM